MRCSQLNYSEVVQELGQKHELTDSTIDSFYDDKTRFQAKISSINGKNTMAPYQNNKESRKFVHVKKQPFSKLANPTRILLAESEAEILSLFKSYLELVGVESVTADDGDKALDIFHEDKKEGKNYDVVVLDTHLKGTRGLDVAKKIYTRNPNQRIVLLTTSPKEELSKEALNSTAIEGKDILVMPFKLSQLRTAINR